MTSANLHVTNDGRYLISYVNKDYHMDVSVYTIVSEADDGSPMFERAGWVASGDLVESISEAEKFIEGAIKWDGCFNFKFSEQEQCMLHTCTRKEAVGIGELLGEIYDLAAGVISHWDGD